METTLELLDAKGHVAGQRIRLERGSWDDGGSSAEALTNVMGFARVTLQPAAWRVVSPLVRPDRLQVSEANQAFALQVVDGAAEDAPIVEGTVVDGRGAAVMGASVGFASADTFVERALTDADGHFVFQEDAGRVLMLEARFKQLASVAERVRVPARARRLFLYPTQALRLTFTGEVVPSAMVQVEHLGKTSVIDWKQGQTRPVPVGEVTLRVRAISRGRLFTGQDIVDVLAGQPTEERIRLRAAPGLRVRVVGATGAPQGGIDVLALPLFGPSDPNAQPEADGARALAVKGTLRGLTDRNGACELVPAALFEFEPLYRLTTGGAVRPSRAVLARLGDGPVTLEVEAER